MFSQIVTEIILEVIQFYITIFVIFSMFLNDNKRKYKYVFIFLPFFQKSEKNV